MKTKQIKIFIFVILLFIQAGCTFGGKKSSQVVTSEGVLPPDTKMVGFNINIGPVGNAGANTGQTFVFNISCPNVYQIAGLPAGSSSVGGTWRATVTVVSDGSPTTQLNLPQFANGHIISCIAVLDSMSHLDGTNTVYTSDYQKLTLILDPDQSHTATGGLSAPDNTALSLTTVPNLGMILPNNYTALYYYSKAGTPTDSFYITGAFARGTHGAKTDPGSVLTCGPLEVNKDCYRNYVIGFVYSKSVTEAQNYLKNPAVSAAFQISEDPALPPPENPELVLVQYPSDSEVGKFRYRMYGRAFLENSSTSTAGDPTAINDYFSPTPNSPITDASVQDAGGLFDTNANEMITNASTDFIRKFIFQFYYNIIPPSTTVDQFKNIVKNANSFKIFVIADSTNKWYNNHVTVADPANSNVNLQTVPNTHVSGTPTPYIWDTAHPASDFPNISQIPDAPGAATLGIQNLNALMTVPSDGTNGVYDCTDLKDYYGKESTPTGVAANYTAAPGTVDTADSNKAKILISNLILNKNDKLPEGAEASTPMKNQFFNWGIDDPDNAPEAALSQTQSATYYPQLNKFKLLFIYRNQRSSTVAKKKGFSFMNAAADTTIVRNAYTYVVVNPMTSDGDGGIAPGGGSSADLQLLDEGIETYTITGSPIYVAHNQCKKITIQAWDNDTGTISVPPNPTNNATISFSSNDLNVSFYSSLSDCNNSTGSILSIALNSGKADVFIKNTVINTDAILSFSGSGGGHINPVQAHMNSQDGAEYVAKWVGYDGSLMPQVQYEISYSAGEYQLTEGCHFTTPSPVIFTGDTSITCSYVPVSNNPGCSPSGIITGPSAPCLTCSIVDYSTSDPLGTFVLKHKGGTHLDLYASDSSFPFYTTFKAVVSTPSLSACSLPPPPVVIAGFAVNSGISNSPNTDNPTSITTKTGMCTPLAIRPYNSSNSVMGPQNETINVTLNNNTTSALKLYTSSSCSTSEITNTTINLNTNGQGYVYVKSASDIASVPLKLALASNTSIFTTVNISTVSSTTPIGLYDFIGNWDGTDDVGGPISFTKVIPTSSGYDVSGIVCYGGGNAFRCTYRDSGSCTDPGTEATGSAPCLECQNGMGIYKYSAGSLSVDFGYGSSPYSITSTPTFLNECVLDPS